MIVPEEERVAEKISKDARAAEQKRLQNASFRGFGVGMALAGAVGFAPSIIKWITCCMWSVGSNKPHTDNNFLPEHAVFMIIWLVAVFVQLWSGGVATRRIFHRVFGWLGSGSLFFGMVFAACNITAIDFIKEGQIGPGIYTAVLILACITDLLLGVLRATQKRFAEHKDWMLMAIMMSLDPAIHRLYMWTIHLCTDFRPLDADQVLNIGKMLANATLVVVFGAMAVRARRVNAVTKTNLGLQFLFYIVGLVNVATNSGQCQGCVRPPIYIPVYVFSAILLALVYLLCVWERRLKKAEDAAEKSLLGDSNVCIDDTDLNNA